jgi:hypothetical protein
MLHYITCRNEQVCYIIIHVKWVTRYHGMGRPQVVDGGDGLKIWRVAVNILVLISC